MIVEYGSPPVTLNNPTKSNSMAYRPYFKHGIEQIQELVATSRSDLKVLKVIQYELGHRDRPKARALKAEVDELVRKLSVGAVAPPAPPVTPPRERGPEEPRVGGSIPSQGTKM